MRSGRRTGAGSPAATGSQLTGRGLTATDSQLRLFRGGRLAWFVLGPTHALATSSRQDPCQGSWAGECAKMAYPCDALCGPVRRASFAGTRARKDSAKPLGAVSRIGATSILHQFVGPLDTPFKTGTYWPNCLSFLSLPLGLYSPRSPMIFENLLDSLHEARSPSAALAARKGRANVREQVPKPARV